MGFLLKPGVIFAMLAWLAGSFYALQPAWSVDPFTQSHLTIHSSDGTFEHQFKVEIAKSLEQQALGLMHRAYLPPETGMLFDFGEVRPVSMWMKNTLIALDMLFIKQDGQIESIIERAKPLSLTARRSQGPVRAVLELPGGTVQSLGIAAGDRVVHQIFQGPD
ncbi:MAG: DUF192 domain-containing protein [Pseudomonadota bacterium]